MILFDFLKLTECLILVKNNMKKASKNIGLKWLSEVLGLRDISTVPTLVIKTRIIALFFIG